MANHSSKTITALFDSFPLADAAARFLQIWEKGRPEVKLATLSLVHETGGGQIKVRNYSPHNTMQGV